MSQDILNFSAADARKLVPQKEMDLRELADIIAEIKKCAVAQSATADYPHLGIASRPFVSELVIEHLQKRGFTVNWDPPYGWFISFAKHKDDWGEK
jgi:hypothetical protein